MPAYNCEEYIDQAINSVLNQTFTDFELLIVDDKSTDHTLSRIKKFKDSRIKIHINKNNLGYLKSVNKLFAIAESDFITFQDADDWSERQRFEKQLAELHSDNELMLCGCGITKVNEAGRKTPQKYPTNHFDLMKELTKGRTSIFCGATIMFRREILINTGGFRSFFDRAGAEDIDWFIRAIERNKAANISPLLYNYRQHSSSISKSNKNPLAQHSADIAYLLHTQRKNNEIEFIGDEKYTQLKLSKILGITECETEYSLTKSIQRKSIIGFKKHTLELLTNNKINVLEKAWLLLATTCFSFLPHAIITGIISRSRKKRVSDMHLHILRASK